LLSTQFELPVICNSHQNASNLSSIERRASLIACFSFALAPMVPRSPVFIEQQPEPGSFAGPDREIHAEMALATP